DSLDSCAGRCGYGTDSAYSCQCNPSCQRFGDCCHDYHSICTTVTSCKGRCGETYNAQNSCHCNSKCPQYNNCCSDYSSLCGGGSGSTLPISDSELLSVSELLFSVDENKASPSQLTISPQTLIPNSETATQQDLSPRPLFSYVDKALFSRPTFSSFAALLDNYHRKTGVSEAFSPVQLQEQVTFLQAAISHTAVGQKLYNFLNSKKWYSSEAEFLQDLQMMWFGLYSRSSGQLDSSGFEHVFAGEIKGSKVSGFHNWIQFYLLEKQGLMNYYSHNFDGPWTGYPDVLGMQFNWDGFFKQVGSALIGSSPEFDLALYSLCYIARPGKQCRLSLGGKQLAIQTYTWDKSTYGDGKKYIASAYPVSP
ncbi:ENDOU endoribonuclease, partial [Amia calva]|nr:ENDOU endoribonuclease [Amia calva]